METPLEELMQRDLEHYEEASTAIMHYSSGIPTAIRHYAIDRPKQEEKFKALAKISDKQEEQIAELEAKVKHLAEDNAVHLMMRDVIKEELKKVMVEDNTLKERLEKYRELFDPHNLLGI